MEAIRRRIIEVQNNKHANALREVNCLSKKTDSTAGILKGALAEERKIS